MACVDVQTLPSGGCRRGLVSHAEGGESAALRGRRAVSFNNGGRRDRKPRMYAVASNMRGRDVDSTLGLARAEEGWDKNRKKSDRAKMPTVAPQLDQLMKESVAEIVKNINEAPFLVHIYTSSIDNGKGANQLTSRPSKVVIEKASSDSWPFIRQRWEDGNSHPDGMILVEELQSSDVKEDTIANCSLDSEISSKQCCSTGTRSKQQQTVSTTSSCTKVWGLLVQGRGVSCPSCYVLKTCQVQSCFGFSTHFCLSKVECLGKSVDHNLDRVWLQR